MTILKNLQTKSDQNTHHFKKNSWRSMPPNPPSKAQSDMQISKSEKNNSWSPLSQILGTPLYNASFNKNEIRFENPAI